jgi:hypothetical protein
VFEAGSWNPEIHMVLLVWYVTSVFDSALNILCPMSEGSPKHTIMYAEELFDQGLTGCTFVSGDEVFSYCCHNSYSLYMVILCDLSVVYDKTVSSCICLFIVIFAWSDPSPKSREMRRFAEYLTLRVCSAMRLGMQLWKRVMIGHVQTNQFCGICCHKHLQ